MQTTPIESVISLPAEFMAKHKIPEGEHLLILHEGGTSAYGRASVYEPEPLIEDEGVAEYERRRLIRDLAVAWVRSDRAITASGPDAVGVAQRLANFADEVLGVMDA